MKEILIISLCFPLIVFCQFTDDFSDGDFTNSPSWMGDVGNFEVDSNNTLHLNDSVANNSFLVTQSQSIIDAEWIFNVRLDFSPSTNNYSKVYLTSDMIDLSGPLNGMYVKIGGQTGSIDDISLYTQSGTNSNEIIDGMPGLVTSNPDVRVKVTRDNLGNWELFLDTNGVFFTQGTIFDNSITSSDYFGVYCKYTVTRSDKFWFDDFNVSGYTAIYGCTDITACNYNALANTDDGSCDLPDGCGDPLYEEYDPLVTCSDSLACITLITTDLRQILKNNSKLVKITNVLGQETPCAINTPLFFIYDDGTVERIVVVE